MGRIGILGGSGFVGKHLASELSRAGYPVVILSRRAHRNRALTVLPTVSVLQIEDTSKETLARALTGCDTTINLAGILNEKGSNGRGFREVHVGLCKNFVAASKMVGARRHLHMSALAANQAKAPSHYLRTKGEAEDWVHQQDNEQFAVTSFRPSIIFGPGDSFFNRFAALLRLAPGFFALPCASSIYAPVYVQDLVQAMVQAVAEKKTYGQRYNVCGPKVYTLHDLVQYTADLLALDVRVLGLNDLLSRLAANVMEWLPGKPLSVDNYWSSTVPSVSKESLADFFAIPLQSLETVVPTYVGANSKMAKIDQLRSHYHGG